jgi:hypothetical protein
MIECYIIAVALSLYEEERSTIRVEDQSTTSTTLINLSTSIHKASYCVINPSTAGYGSLQGLLCQK